MKKINGGYVSLFEYLVNENFPFARTIDKIFYPAEHSTIWNTSTAPYKRRYNETPKKNRYIDHFIGTLQPIASMANDFEYTFKPYKYVSDVLIDALQPVRGVLNILRGIGILVATPLLLLGNTVRFALTSGSFSNFSSDMKFNLGNSTSWLMDGVFSLIRGTTQIIASPLTWVLKIPLRGIITGFKGTPDISENEEILRLVDQGDQALKDKDCYTMIA